MRAYGLALMLMVELILASCNRDAHRDEPAARQAGRDAYRASQEIKRGAKEAAQELRKAGKEVREGWNEAKRQDDTRPRK
jgi:hypothetical protein